MKHKDDIDVITRVWFELYQRGKHFYPLKNVYFNFLGSDNLKTALIYVMNDAVQAAKHAKDTTVPMAFHPHFVNAATFASEGVKKPIKRCLEVFSDRSVYPKHVIDEMRAALGLSVYSKFNNFFKKS